MPLPQDSEFVARGRIRDVDGDRVTIYYSTPADNSIIENISRQCIIGNTWYQGWSGSVFQDRDKRIYFLAD